VTEVLKVIIKRLEDLKDEDLRALLSRDVGLQDVLTAVNDIIVDVGSKGDEALFKYTEKFEGAQIDDLRVSQEEIDASYDLV
jgi:histidinol dehydrogenase